MSDVSLQSSAGLSVQLDGGQRVYAFGDMLTGSVTYSPKAAFATSHVESARMNLLGLSEVSLFHRRSNPHPHNVYTYQRKVVIVEKELILQDDSICGQESYTWRFRIELPRHYARLQDEDGLKPMADFLDATDDDAMNQPLPSVFYDGNGESLSRQSRHVARACIEYVLNATVSVPTSHMKQKFVDRTASIPLMVRQIGTDCWMEDLKMEAHSQPMVFKSLKLDSSRNDPKLMDHVKMILRPSKIPEYPLTLTVHCPSVIQIDNPRIPFELSIEPLDGDSGSAIGSVDVKLLSIKLTLKMETKYRCPAILMRESERIVHDVDLYHKNIENSPVVLSQTPVDLTTPMGLCLMRTRVRYEGQKSRGILLRPVWPTFKTFILSVVYSLCWEIVVECADKTKTVSGEQPCVVLSEPETVLRHQLLSDTEDTACDPSDIEMALERSVNWNIRKDKIAPLTEGSFF